jgi:chromosome segregation ATPase
MTDQTDITPDGAQNTDRHETNTVPYARFKEVNDARKNLEERLAKLEAAQATAEQKRLEEEQRYQELANSYKGELDRVKPVAGQVDEWKAALKETADTQTAQLPDDMRDLVPEYDDPRQTLAWLNKNAARLMRPAAPAMDAGQRGDSAGQTLKLTPDQEQVLAKVQRVDPSMTRERYIAALIRQGGG